MKRGKVLILAVVCLVAVSGALASTAAGADSLGVRTSKVLNAMRKCSNGLPLVSQVLQGGDSLQASEAVSLVKDGCAGLRRTVGRISDNGFEEAALSAWSSLDYWERGLGRISDYIDYQRPSDATTAQTYFARARALQRAAIVGMNQARAKEGLTAFRLKNGI